MTPFDPLFVPPELRTAVSDESWLTAMLEFERGLARAEASVGVVPAEAADAIAGSCRADLFDSGALAEEGRSVGNPAEPLVRALRERVGGEASDYVHWGATSQDVMDTASMLVARRAVELVLATTDRLADALAALAAAHRSTPMVARTLLQQAAPTTFGYKAAGWLVSLHEARARLAAVRSGRLAVQLGGAVGTLAPLGAHGPAVLEALAGELELAEPIVPWHSDRTRVAELGAALSELAAVAEKIALDLALLAQTEVGEVREATGGGSSTLPHKRNPAGSALVRASARIARAHASVLAGGPFEHERGVGGWQAEWPALSGALAFTGGAVSGLADVLASLEVDAGRMRANLGADGGLVLSERIAFALAGRLGRAEAHALVREIALQAAESGRAFADELRANERVTLPAEEIEKLLDSATYLGSAEQFVDRALALHGEERK